MTDETHDDPKHLPRRITLDPLQLIDIPTKWREVESTIPCGFRMSWVEGEKDGQAFTLCYGVGSPWCTFQYKGRGFCIDMTSVINDLLTFVDQEEGPKNEEE